MRKSEDRSLAVTTLHTTGMTTGPSQDTTRYPEGGTRKLTGPEGPKGPTEGAGRTRGGRCQEETSQSEATPNNKQKTHKTTEEETNNTRQRLRHTRNTTGHQQESTQTKQQPTHQDRESFFFRPTPDGSRQVVYQAGKTIALCKFTELMQWKHWP